jgi:vacuolar protein sorting-associated protein 16
MRDTNKLAILRTSSVVLAKSQVQIWSPAGEGLVLFSVRLAPLLPLAIAHLCLKQWDTRIVRFGWTSSERLVLLNEEGIYRLYDLQGNYEQFSLGGEAAETSVLDARIWEEGMVYMTGSMGFWELREWGSRPSKLADSGGFYPSLCSRRNLTKSI